MSPRFGDSLQKQEDRNLDPKNNAVLRATLEEMVKAKEGTLDLDLERWSLVVRRIGGRAVARCLVRNGMTVVVR